ncbi:MAG: purine-binding chemotaxis protein CheW [Rhodospirillaceae bacterium]|nr:MAG: purine-binding chemotaxis protein CheW [Rhodospirillaceae bacterium]
MRTPHDRVADTAYLTFGLGEEMFAAPVIQVREVLDVLPFTRIPYAPPFLRGMVDVCGHGVPVIDLRARFGLPDLALTPHHRILVLEVLVEGTPLVLGALTDRVYEVTAFDSTALEPPPNIGLCWRSDIIQGIGRRHERFVIVLHLNRLFTLEDLRVDEAEEHTPGSLGETPPSPHAG